MEERKTKPVIYGRMWCTDDPGAVVDAMARGFVIVGIIDTGQQLQAFRTYPQYVQLSNLYPPPMAITELLDGDPNRGDQLYLDYLNTEGRKDSFVCLLAALHQMPPRDILLYTDHDCNVSFHVLRTICFFLQNRFGIIVGQYGNPNCPPSVIFNDPFTFVIVDLLFTCGFINKYEYADLIPPHAIPSPESVGLLLRDFNYGFRSLEDCHIACANYLRQLRMELNTGKQAPMLRAKEKIDKIQEEKINELVKESNTRFGNKNLE